MSTETKNAMPVERFGKDHWSTFAYVVCRVIDYKGMLRKAHMRTNPSLHPGIAGIYPMNNQVMDGSKYPTRLKAADGSTEWNKRVELKDHDDWSCIEDCIAAGLISEPPDRGTGLNPVYEITDLGWEVSKQLDKFKAGKGNFHSFKPVSD